jgi:hypothetical protein
MVQPQRPLADNAVYVGDGRVLLPRALCERYFAATPAAVLLEREDGIYLVPLGGPSAGGMLLKQRNAHGDRVLLAEEFLSPYGLGRFSAERAFAVRWTEMAGALQIVGLELLNRG